MNPDRAQVVAVVDTVVVAATRQTGLIISPLFL
jgi:hypothetical protein